MHVAGAGGLPTFSPPLRAAMWEVSSSPSFSDGDSSSGCNPALATATSSQPEAEGAPSASMAGHTTDRPGQDTLEDRTPPPALPGTEWWHNHLWHSMAHHLQKLPHEQTRPVHILSGCSGLLSEAWAPILLGIHCTFEASEPKPMASAIALQNFGDMVSHMWTDITSAMTGVGHCHKHSAVCTHIAPAAAEGVPSAERDELGGEGLLPSEGVPSTRRIILSDVSAEGSPPAADILVMGTPCQPFSRMRHRLGGTSKSSKSWKDHPQAGLTAETIRDILQTRQPLGAIFEQVLGFEDEGALTQFTSMLQAQGYQVGRAKLDARVWAQVSRPRFYLAAFSEALGGRAAAEMWCQRLQEVVKCRSNAFPAEVIGDILSEDDTMAMDIIAQQDPARCSLLAARCSRLAARCSQREGWGRGHMALASDLVTACCI